MKKIIAIVLAVIVVFTLAITAFAQTRDSNVTEWVARFSTGTGEAMSPIRPKSNDSPVYVFCTSSPYNYYVIPCGATSINGGGITYMGAMTSITPRQAYYLSCNNMYSQGYGFAMLDAWGQGANAYTAIMVWAPDSM